MIKGPDKNEIRKQIEVAKKGIQDELVYELTYIGRRAVNVMRASNGYYDQSGNLRSSCGYAVAYKGDVKAQSGFKVVKGGEEGAETGKALSRTLSAENSQGQRYALVLVAGMNYASYVQNLHGRDVIESAVISAQKDAEYLERELGNGN